MGGLARLNGLGLKQKTLSRFSILLFSHYPTFEIVTACLVKV
jgi:hypothetical protein